MKLYKYLKNKRILTFFNIHFGIQLHYETLFYIVVLKFLKNNVDIFIHRENLHVPPRGVQ